MKDKLIQVGIDTFKKVSRYHTFNVRQVKVETTKVCNLRCPSCRRTYTASISTEPGPKHLTVGALWRIIATTDMMVVRFEGDGEPTCNPYFKDLVTYCNKLGIRSAMTTNATLLDKEYINFLEGNGMTRIHVSFDGAERDTFEKARLGADYGRVLYNCKLIGRSKIQLFMSVLMSSDKIIDELPEYVTLAKDVGAVGILLMKLQRETLEWDTPDWTRHKGVVKEFERKARGKGLIYVGTITEEPRFIGCEDSFVCPYVLLNDDVYACSYMANLRRTEVYLDRILPVPYLDYRMGNLNDNWMRDIWFSKDWKVLRETLIETRKVYLDRKLSQEELLDLKLKAEGRFGYCMGCPCRWGESGI